MSLIVYKSSAGSGKTSTLVIEYLALALKRPRQFRQIIALTFTIKATSEMKERLIEYLIYLQKMDINNIDNQYKHIVDKLEDITKFSKQNLKENSIILLNRILHNYSDFGFSTIDSFVVGIVRSFAHDLQLDAKFEIELDQESIINQALEKFYELIGKEENITNFLVDYVLNQLDDEKSTDLDSPLSKLAKLTFESKHYANIELLKNIELDNFDKIRNVLQNELNIYNKKIAEYGQKGLNCLEKYGLEPKDCSRGWLHSYFTKLKNNHKYIYDISDLEKTTFLSYIKDDGDWYVKKQKVDVINRILEAKPEILEIIDEARNYYLNQLPFFNTYKLILKKITPLALIHILKEIIYNNSLENDTVHLSEVNRKIAEVIQDQHAPYIYERIGHQYSNYLIDEFQDTSVIQWNNILPLIDNSLSTGKRCLLVGDAKQSIYRWRDGEVEQFVNLPKLKGSNESKLIAERQNLIENTIKIENLDTNYRSLKNIVDFNNTLFSHLLGFEEDYVKNVFFDFFQKTPKTKNEGYIKLKNFDNDTDNKELLQEIFNQIQDLTINQQYNPNDICVLARRKKNLSEIADFLLENNIKVMSSEALLLHKSKDINFIISLINIIEGIDVSINSYIVTKYLHQHKLINNISSFSNSDEFFNYLQKNNIHLNYSELRQFTIIEIVEQIISNILPQRANNPFIFKLLDVILEQNSKIGSSASSFLKYWEDNNTNLSINIPESTDAVRLLTIHSAKGLEFPVVIFPTLSLDNKLDGRDYLWITPPEIISELSPILLTGNDQLGIKSSEKALFTEDEERKKLDSLNLFYVACTRPTEQLFLYFSKKKGSVDLWNTKFKNLPIINPELEKREENEIIIGTPPIHIINKDSKLSPKTSINGYIYNDWRTKIRIKTDYRQDEVEEKKQKGIQLHFLLSQLNDIVDINELLDKTILNKKVSQEYKSEFSKILYKLIDNTETNIFFNHNDKYIAEKEILTENNKTLRPDKIIYKADEIWVVDFKYADRASLSDLEINNHNNQVNEYVQNISQIEPIKTKGFLLYLQGLTSKFDVNQ